MPERIQFYEEDQTILFVFDNVDCDAKVNGGVVAVPEVTSGNFQLTNAKRIQLQLQYWFNERHSTQNSGA